MFRVKTYDFPYYFGIPRGLKAHILREKKYIGSYKKYKFRFFVNPKPLSIQTNSAMKNGHKIFLLLTVVSYIILYGLIALFS
jgi:hypothetical protein